MIEDIRQEIKTSLTYVFVALFLLFHFFFFLFFLQATKHLNHTTIGNILLNSVVNVVFANICIEFTCIVFENYVYFKNTRTTLTITLNIFLLKCKNGRSVRLLTNILERLL